MQHGDERLELAGTEARLESFDGLRRERNFRHQHDGALALLERVREGLEINLGLAAAGDAVEQKGRKIGRPKLDERRTCPVSGFRLPASDIRLLIFSSAGSLRRVQSSGCVGRMCSRA